MLERSGRADQARQHHPAERSDRQGGQLAEIESNLEVAYFNAHDSVCGHQFTLTNYNDKGDPATSLGIARQIVAQGNTIIMEDSLSSAQNQDQPYLMQQHVLVVNGDGARGCSTPSRIRPRSAPSRRTTSTPS